jgi:predicted nicotinamide N-methyase
VSIHIRSDRLLYVSIELNIATQQARLLERIRRDFAVRTDAIRIGSIDLNFIRVADPDKVLDDVCAQEEASRAGIKPKRPLRMPYWAAVWESAAAVGQHLQTAHPSLVGVNALDLGCGMGLAGMVLAAMGARVTLGDIETAALLFAAVNVLPWESRCDVRRIDWQTDRLGRQFDLIVGSDVLYERAQWDFIEPFLTMHLAASGKVVIGEPGRPKAEEFPAWIRARGWTLDATTQLVVGRPTPINVLTLARDS